MKTILHLDRSLNILKADERSSEFFGCTLSTIVGTDISLLFHLKKAQFPSQELLLQTTWPYEFSSTFKIEDRDCAVNGQINLASQFFSDANQPGFVLSLEFAQKRPSPSLSDHIVHSLSQGVLSESSVDALRLIQQIIEGMPGRAHFKRAESLCYQYANVETLKLLGMVHIKELLHLNDYDIAKHMKWRWPGSLAESIQDLDKKVILSRAPIIAFEEEPYFDANNKLVSHLLTKIPIYTPDQTPVGIVTFAIDVTQNKDIHWLRNTYMRIYPDKKLGFQLFLENIGLLDVLKERNPHLSSPHSVISERQFDTLVLITHGKTVKECAKILGISNRTVEQYVEQLREKFNCQAKSDLATIYHKIIHQKFSLA